MRDINGTKVLVTPSIIYRSGYAVAAINGGEGGYLHVREDGLDTHGGVNSYCFPWKVFDESMNLVGESGDDEIRAPVMDREGDERALDAMSALISFLYACAESTDPDSDNYSLFVDEIREWAEMNSDNLAMVALEIEEERAEWGR